MRLALSTVNELITDLACGFMRTARLRPEGRDASWAQPCHLEGLKNCYKLEEDLYRSAQPSAKGFVTLERLGFTHVLSLRIDNPDLRFSRTLHCHHIPMSAFIISLADIEAALAILCNRAYRPLLLHCLHGSDRTGLVCAAYRVVVQGWPREMAIEELVAGGYGYHPFFTNMVTFIRNLEIEQMRRRLAISP
jgi:protein tyrosine phosphatase (PTP) superfamily phosphohydrolase (DUF442 family)